MRLPSRWRGAAPFSLGVHMANGFMTGFNSQQNQFLARQAEELDQALQLASMISQQQAREEARQAQKEEREYQREQRTYQREQNKFAKERQAQEDAFEREKHRDIQERLKKSDEFEKIQRAFSIGEKFADSTATQGELLGIIKAAGAPSSAIDEIIRAGLSGLKAKKKADYDAQPGPQSQEALPPWDLSNVQSMSSGQPQQGMPPFMQGAGGIAGVMAGPIIGQQPQPPMMPPPIPQDSPMLQPMDITPQRPPFMEPTESDFLNSMSPAYAIAQEKLKVDAALKQARTDVLRRTMDLKEELDPKALEIKIAEADIKRRDFDLKTYLVDQRIGPYARSLSTLDRDYIRQNKLDESLIKHRSIMEGVAERNATTSERRASVAESRPAAVNEVLKVTRLMDQEVQRSQDLEIKKAQADVAYKTAYSQLQEQKTRVSLLPSITDEQKIALAHATERLDSLERHTRAVSAEWETIAAQAKIARDRAQSLKNIEDSMRSAMAEKGLTEYSDGKGSGPVTPLPRTPKRPTAPPIRKQFQDKNGNPKWFTLKNGAWVPG